MLSCFIPKKIDGSVFNNYKIYLLVAYALLSTLTLLWSEETMEGAKVLERMISFVLMPLLFISHKERFSVHINKVYFICGIALFIATILVLVNLMQVENFSYLYNYNNISEKLIYVRYLIHQNALTIHPSYLSYLAIIYISYTAFNIKQINTINSIHIIFSVVAFALIIMLSSRAAFLTIIFLLLYAISKQLFLKRYVLFSIIFLVALASAFVAYKHTRLGQTIQNINSENREKPKDERIILWENAWELVKDKPLFGYGIGDAIFVMIDKHKETGFDAGAEKQLDAHNQFLEIMLQSGLLGLIPFLLALILPLIQAIKKKQEILFLFLIVSIIQLCFESMFVRLAGVVYFAFFYCYLYFMHYGINKPQHNRETKLN